MPVKTGTSEDLAENRTFTNLKQIIGIILANIELIPYFCNRKVKFEGYVQVQYFNR